METFTDAAFAFALTLLVVSFEPPTSLGALIDSLRDVPAFLLSATFLMVFWWGHHQWSRRYGMEDGVSVLLSCALVFTVLIYVYPLRFMFGLMFTWAGYLAGLPIGSPDVRLDSVADLNTVFLIYGLGFMAMALILAMLHHHAWRRREALELDAFERHETRTNAKIWVVLAAVGGLSCAVALLTPPTRYGAPGWVYMVLPVLVPWVAARAERRRPEVPPG